MGLRAAGPRVSARTQGYGCTSLSGSRQPAFGRIVESAGPAAPDGEQGPRASLYERKNRALADHAARGTVGADVGPERLPHRLSLRILNGLRPFRALGT